MIRRGGIVVEHRSRVLDLRGLLACCRDRLGACLSFVYRSSFIHAVGRTVGY